jgi:hypothetical protein
MGELVVAGGKWLMANFGERQVMAELVARK